MANINKIKLPDGVEYEINDARIPSDEAPATKEWVEEQGFGVGESSPTVIDVVTLPTVDIQSDALYRRYSCLYYYGYTLQENDRSLEKYMNCSVVSRLEDVTDLEKAMPLDDSSQLVTYYDISRQNAFGFSTYELDATAVLTTIDGYWYPVEAFFVKMNLPYAGIITELPSAIEQMINAVDAEEKQYYLLVQPLLFSYVGDAWQLINNYSIYLPFSKFVDEHASTWTVPDIWQEMIKNHFTSTSFYTNNKWVDFGTGHNNFIPVECYSRYSHPVFKEENVAETAIKYYFKGNYTQDFPQQDRTYIAVIEGYLNNEDWTLTTSDTEGIGGSRFIILYSEEGTLHEKDMSAILAAAQSGSVNSVVAMYNNKILTFTTFSMDPESSQMVSISFDETESYILMIDQSSGAYTIAQSPFTPGKLTGTSGQLSSEKEGNVLFSKAVSGSGLIVQVSETTCLFFSSFTVTNEATMVSSTRVNGKNYDFTINLATLAWSIEEEASGGEVDTSNLVDLTSVQTISGQKTFSNGINLSNSGYSSGVSWNYTAQETFLTSEENGVDAGAFTIKNNGRLYVAPHGGSSAASELIVAGAGRGNTSYTNGAIVRTPYNGTPISLTLPSAAGILATQEWVQAQGYGGGSSIDTSDLQVKKLSLLDPGNSVAGYLAPQTSYGGLQLSAKTFVPRIVPTDNIHDTVGQTSPYTTQLLEGGIVLNTSYSETNLDGVIRLIFPTDRLTDQTFATREWVNDRQWNDSNGELGRVLIDADHIELTLGDQIAGIFITQNDGIYDTTIWGDSINLAGPVNYISLGDTGWIEHDGACVTIGDSANLYLFCADGDSTIDMSDVAINYYANLHSFRGDITAQRSGETTPSKVMAAADFTYTDNILTIKLS